MIDFYTPFKKIDVTIEMFYCERDQRNSDLWQFRLIYLDIIQGMEDSSVISTLDTLFIEKQRINMYIYF